jgi:hypothetical protein
LLLAAAVKPHCHLTLDWRPGAAGAAAESANWAETKAEKNKDLVITASKAEKIKDHGCKCQLCEKVFGSGYRRQSINDRWFCRTHYRHGTVNC